jgi:hypothetical protein
MAHAAALTLLAWCVCLCTQPVSQGQLARNQVACLWWSMLLREHVLLNVAAVALAP